MLVYSRFLNCIILGSCGVFGQTQKATLFPGSPLFCSWKDPENEVVIDADNRLVK